MRERIHELTPAGKMIKALLDAKRRKRDFAWLADECEISPQYLNDMISGRVPFPPHVRERIVAALEVPEYMVFGANGC